MSIAPSHICECVFKKSVSRYSKKVDEDVQRERCERTHLFFREVGNFIPLLSSHLNFGEEKTLYFWNSDAFGLYIETPCWEFAQWVIQYVTRKKIRSEAKYNLFLFRRERFMFLFCCSAICINEIPLSTCPFHLAENSTSLPNFHNNLFHNYNECDHLRELSTLVKCLYSLVGLNYSSLRSE